MTQKLSSSPGTICLDEHSTLKNTLCIDCLSKYLEDWMKDKPKNIKTTIKKELSKNKISKISGEECLVCSKHKILFCPYCFIDILYEKLKDNSQNKLANSLIKLL